VVEEVFDKIANITIHDCPSALIATTLPATMRLPNHLRLGPNCWRTIVPMAVHFLLPEGLRDAKKSINKPSAQCQRIASAFEATFRQGKEWNG